MSDRTVRYLKWPLLTLYLVAQACHAQPACTLQGKINLFEGWKPLVYLVHPRQFSEVAADYLGEVVDSARVAADGTISLSYVPKVAGGELYFLTMQKEGTRFATHLDDTDPMTANYMPIILDGQHAMAFTASSSAFQASFKINTPDPNHAALMSLRDIRHQAYSEYHQKQIQAEDNDTLLLDREKEFMQYADHFVAFADTTQSMLAAMVAIRWISPAGDYERFAEFMSRQCKKWSASSPDYSLVPGLCANAAADILPVMVGDTMPDYRLPMVNGDTLPLHLLLGKNLTIVDIWASWCAPCRKENKMILVPLWNQYKDQGLQILGYSIDSDGGAWQRAIEKDQATWSHASHLSGDETPFLKALRITTIPANYMLDENGKVVAKNIYGEDLKQWVDGYMQQTK